MNKPVKTKLCWNCEGSVSRTAENCPYCAVYLSPEVSEEKSSSLLKPPYSPEQNKSKEIPKAPYTPKEEEVAVEAAIIAEESTSINQFYLPLFLLTSGLIALIFSFILFFFSTNGKLTMQWDASIWYIYALIAMPLLFFGWRSIDKS